jgi:WhiB family redox-sensing transcriptional regulator
MFALTDSSFATGRDPGIDWDLARCNDGSGALAALFFSEQIDDINTAKSYCAECPIAAACLDGAIERREPWGVWGGELFWNGKILPYKRKRGRPPKVRPAAELEAIERYRERYGDDAVEAIA